MASGEMPNFSEWLKRFDLLPDEPRLPEGVKRQLEEAEKERKRREREEEKRRALAEAEKIVALDSKRFERSSKRKERRKGR